VLIFRAQFKGLPFIAPALWLIVFVFRLSPAAAAEGLPSAKVEEVRSAILNHIAAVKFTRAQWGIVVAEPSGKPILEVNAHKLMKPASVGKLLVVAAALEELGPDYRFTTSAYTYARPQNGRVGGPLIIYGRGDPSFESRFLTNAATTDLLAEQIAKSGLRRVRGPMVLDTSYYDAIRHGTGWTHDDTQYGYGTVVSALNFRENVTLLEVAAATEANLRCTFSPLDRTFPYKLINATRTASDRFGLGQLLYGFESESTLTIYGTLPLGSTAITVRAPVRSPEEAFAQALTAALRSRGVRVGKAEVTRRSPRNEPTNNVNDLFEVASVQSPPLRELSGPILRDSQNLYSQSLLLHLGARSSKDPALTVEEAGAAQVKETLAQLGIEPADVQLDDGTGLSRSGLVTPRAVVMLLKATHDTPTGTLLKAMVPAPGEGTLKNRLPSLSGKLRAKTGSLRTVSTVAGYLTTRSAARVVFCVFLNNYTPEGNAPAARDEVEAVVQMLHDKL